MNDKNNVSHDWNKFLINKVIELARSYSEGSARFGIEKNEELWREALSKLTKTERDNFIEWIHELSGQLRERLKEGNDD